jgi:DNA-binding transcriptional LysR family regulator
MEMHQIRYFLAVAKTLNFTRAADQCNVTQPSLTRAIQKLEDEFGGLLFNRERALTHLTELGRMVLPHLEQTFEAAEAASLLASSIGRAEVTPLVIGVARGVASPVLDEILSALTVALPGLTIDLRAGTSEQLIEMSLKGGMDLLLIALPDLMPDRMETWPLYVQPYHVASARAQDQTSAMPRSLSELSREIWIDCADDGTAMWRKTAAEAGIELRFRHRVDGPEMALRLILQNLGSAVLPGHMQAAGVTMATLTDQSLGLEVVLGAVAGRRRGRAADAFLRAARARDWQAGCLQSGPVRAASAASTSVGSAL